MNKLILIVFNLFVLRFTISTPVNSINATNKDTIMAVESSLPDIAKSADDTFNGSRSAGTAENLDHSRAPTPHERLLQKLENLTRQLKTMDFIPPSVGVPITSAQASIVPSPYTNILPSFGSHGYGFAPAVPPTPAVASLPFKKPIFSIFSKPNTPTVSQPVYPIISQQVIHKPYYTEMVEIVRRPVLSIAEEVIHKPFLMEVQQVLKKPLFTQHVIKPGVYDKIQQEIYQPPLRVPGESIHVLDKPVSKIVSLPTKVLQASFVQQPSYSASAPIIPPKPSFAAPASSAVGFGPVSGFGSSHSIVPGYGSSGGYGYPSYAYAPSYESGQSGISSSQEGVEHQYFTPASNCRATGTCLKDPESDKTSTRKGDLFKTMPYTWWTYNPSSMTMMNYNSQMMPMDYYVQTPYSHIFDTESANVDKPSQNDFSDSIISENKKSVTTTTESKSSESDDIPPMEDFLKQDKIANEALITIQKRYMKMAEEAKNKKKQKTESFDVQESLKQAAHLAKVNPNRWTELFKKDVAPELQSLSSVPNGDQSKKSSN